MGNLCGKQANSNFEGQGRTLGSAPASVTKASIPSSVTASAPQPGASARPLGGGRSGDGSGAAAAAAAAAAEARANKTSSGELQKKLDAQKRQTQNQTLQQVSNENRMARAADQATEARNYN